MPFLSITLKINSSYHKDSVRLFSITANHKSAVEDMVRDNIGNQIVLKKIVLNYSPSVQNIGANE